MEKGISLNVISAFDATVFGLPISTQILLVLVGSKAIVSLLPSNNSILSFCAGSFLGLEPDF